MGLDHDIGDEGLQALAAREESEAGISALKWTRMILSTILYYLISVAVYTQLEVHDDGHSWSIIDSLYFCTVTMSTVGYGDLTPSTPGTKAFTALWIFVGVTIIFTQIYACFGSLIVPITRRGRDILENGVALAFPRTFVDIDGDGEADFLVPRHWFLAYSQGMLPTILLNWCMQVFFAMVFVAIEGWNFGDAFWHCW